MYHTSQRAYEQSLCCHRKYLRWKSRLFLSVWCGQSVDTEEADALFELMNESTQGEKIRQMKIKVQ